MPICIECRYPVNQLYTTYSRADDRALGRGVRLTLCPRCNKFADKYVEHDFVVMFLDLVLIKPQVYRHLLFNRLGRDDGGFDPSILRLAILLVLFDVYLTWARIERDAALAAPVSSPFSRFLGPLAVFNSTEASDSSILTYALPLQYIFFLLLCIIETVAFHVPIRLLASHVLSPDSKPKPASATTPDSRAAASTSPSSRTPHPNSISTALVVSSCSKLFPVLMVIWDYDLPSSASAVSWAVIFNNIAALQILLDCGYLRAGALAGAGAACRWVCGGLMLAGGGLGGIGAGSALHGVVAAAAGDGATAGGALAAVGREIGTWVGLV